MSYIAANRHFSTYEQAETFCITCDFDPSIMIIPETDNTTSKGKMTDKKIQRILKEQDEKQMELNKATKERDALIDEKKNLQHQLFVAKNENEWLKKFCKSLQK